LTNLQNLVRQSDVDLGQSAVIGCVATAGAIVLVVLLVWLWKQNKGSGLASLVRPIGLTLWYLAGASAYLAAWIAAAFGQYQIFYIYCGLHLLFFLAMVCLPPDDNQARWIGFGVLLTLVVLLWITGIVLGGLALSRDLYLTVGALSDSESLFKQDRIVVTFYVLSGWLLLTGIVVAVRHWERRVVLLQEGRARGASLLAESANFFAVIAGLGGYYVFEEWGDGWQQIGIAGGWLATIMGLWLHARWLFLARTAGIWWDPYAKGDEPMVERAATIASELIGILAVLSILTPSANTKQDAAIASAILLGIATLALPIYAAFNRREFKRKLPGTWGWVAVSVLLLAGGTALAGVFAGYPDFKWGNAGRIIGLVGILFVILVEAMDSWPFTQKLLGLDPANKELTEYLGWEKNLWMVLGALVTGIYMLLSWENAQGKPISGLEAKGIEHSAVFLGGAVLAGIGTLRGLINVLTQPLETPVRQTQRTADVPLPDLGALSESSLGEEDWTTVPAEVAEEQAGDRSRASQ
jgi:hypothetical protein